RNETVDAHGRPVTTTHYGSVYRDVGFEGADAGEQSVGGTFDMPYGATRLPLAVPAWLAHAYSECSRIWNPLHTHVPLARSAGLPGIILHGTATLALAVSQVMRHAEVDPRAVRRVRARFTGMVPLPSRLSVRVLEATDGHAYLFDVLGDDDAPVLSRGILTTTAISL